MRRILGVSPHEPATAETFALRVHPQDRATLAAHESALEAGRAAEAEVRIVRPDGSVRNVKLKSVRQAGDSADAAANRGTLQDVTEQRRLQEQLAHAQKMEAIGRLAGGVAHDLNNHLMVIQCNLDVLQLPESSELKALRSAIGAAAQTTSRLLAFGRSSTLRRRIVDPNQLVSQTLLLLERVIAEDINLRSQLESDLPSVDVDEGMIGQSIVNLVLNARDAVSSGGTIEVLTRRTRDNPPLVEIAVRDDGTGMDEATRARIFEPFFTTKTDGKGSGLGLAMAQGTVAQHGGTLTVVSEARRGSTFTMRLPAASRAATVPPPATVPAQRQGAVGTILIVEDQAPVAAVLKRLLETDGHRVLVAERPTRALEIVRELGREIDLVISDVVMPEMRGPALVEKIHATGLRPRVLFMSGYANDEIAPGVLVHLRKPFLRSELRQAVAEALGDARQSTEARSR
jgi:signal transduction histidine kinase/ActR/RegA family two-component response regulator